MELFRTCIKCKGTGIFLEDDCDHCSGTGFLSFGEVGSDIDVPVLATRIDTPTHHILECTTASEYTALSAANKDAYRQIISCGEVDLSDGTGIRTKLWNMFDENSTTRANLITLLGE